MKISNKVLILSFIFIFGFFMFSYKECYLPYQFYFKTIPIKIETACSPSKIQKGLMFRKTISNNYGMLFVYPFPQKVYFWMKNTSIPLDIAFLDSNYKILQISQMSPHSDKIISSPIGTKYAIETNIFWFNKNKIYVGDSLRLCFICI